MNHEADQKSNDEGIDTVCEPQCRRACTWLRYKEALRDLPPGESEHFRESILEATRLGAHAGVDATQIVRDLLRHKNSLKGDRVIATAISDISRIAR